ncbi:MAG: hypothetical protein GY867_02005 [bacterium]|nr:hypothetical protein [bacterium]
MKSALRRIFGSTYIKVAFGGVVAACGIVAGVYIGFALTGTPSYTLNLDDPSLVRAPEPKPPEDYFPTFEAGDLFPWAEYQDELGAVGTFEDLLKGQRSVLLFVHPGCEPCHELLYRWSAWSGMNLAPDIQVVLCVGLALDEADDDTRAMIDGYQSVFVDRTALRESYNLKVWPTTICVDEYGLITALQVGFRGVFSQEIARNLR